MNDSSEDWPLVQASLGGDENAYAELIRRHQAMIQKQLRWIAPDLVVCDELVHETFVSAYFSLSTYRKEAPFVHWLRKIASRVGYRHLKKQAALPSTVPLEDWDATAAPQPAETETSHALLRDLLGRLSPEERMVLTLTYFEELGTREIAERMGWNRAMVKMRVYRAKNKLKKMVADEKLFEQYDL